MESKNIIKKLNKVNENIVLQLFFETYDYPESVGSDWLCDYCASNKVYSIWDSKNFISTTILDIVDSKEKAIYFNVFQA